MLKLVALTTANLLSLYWINTISLRTASTARSCGKTGLAMICEGLKNSGVGVLVSMLTQNEMKELAWGWSRKNAALVALSTSILRFEDRGLPKDISRFKEFVDQIVTRTKEGKSVAIHCRAGIGRSSLLLCQCWFSLASLAVRPGD